MLFSADDDSAGPTPELIDIALRAVREAGVVDLRDLSARIKNGIAWPDVWPGEHYKLLAGIAKLLQPKLVIEIGTATGLSALALRKYMPPGSKLITFDVVSWRNYPDCVLSDSDFADGSLIQHIADLSDGSQFATHRASMENADIVFIDAAKDGRQEQLFLDNFETCQFQTSPLFVFDDIRLWNMLKIWRSVKRPKLDITSFGHWSGTGLIQWQPSAVGTC
jgi:hypothetical protein